MSTNVYFAKKLEKVGTNFFPVGGSIKYFYLEPRFRQNDHGEDKSSDEEEKFNEVNDEPWPDQNSVSGSRCPDE